MFCAFDVFCVLFRAVSVICSDCSQAALCPYSKVVPSRGQYCTGATVACVNGMQICSVSRQNTSKKLCTNGRTDLDVNARQAGTRRHS